MNYKTVMTPNDFNSSFLALQSDQEKIWRKLFVESRPYSDILKRLLVINTPDCLDKSKAQYDKTIKEFSLKRLHDEEYIRLVPKLSSSDHEEVKSYIILEFDDFTPTDNPQFRDCTISFTIISNLDCWELNDYKLRPQLIAAYIDGIINNARLSGIGTLQFMGASQVVLNEFLGGMVLRYIATNGEGNSVYNNFSNMNG